MHFVQALALVKEDVDESRMDDLSYVYSGYAPVSARIVHQVASALLCAALTPLMLTLLVCSSCDVIATSGLPRSFCAQFLDPCLKSYNPFLPQPPPELALQKSPR
jgi:hypothetical protein